MRPRILNCNLRLSHSTQPVDHNRKRGFRHASARKGLVNVVQQLLPADKTRVSRWDVSHELRRYNLVHGRCARSAYPSRRRRDGVIGGSQPQFVEPAQLPLRFAGYDGVRCQIEDERLELDPFLRAPPAEHRVDRLMAHGVAEICALTDSKAHLPGTRRASGSMEFVQRVEEIAPRVLW
jgi:hypothetical protein